MPAPAQDGKTSSAIECAPISQHEFDLRARESLHGRIHHQHQWQQRCKMSRIIDDSHFAVRCEVLDHRCCSAVSLNRKQFVWVHQHTAQHSTTHRHQPDTRLQNHGHAHAQYVVNCWLDYTWSEKGYNVYMYNISREYGTHTHVHNFVILYIHIHVRNVR